ncbi:MAG: polyphenol oxidase family protein [Gemmatimonadales bacterium]|nr:polyphenol oxidase family protein [Gemmatimonadales bacterium]
MSSALTTEVRVPGPVPRWDVPGWTERYGVVAGITGRGEAAEPFDLGLWGRGPVADSMTRWRAFRHAFPGFPAQVLAHQVHGNKVKWHDHAGEGWTLLDGADGHATPVAGLLLLVTVADCIPVFLVAPRQRAVALLHAGWRGTADGILERGVAILGDRAGARPEELVCHLGVGISGPAYEVGAEVMAGVGLEHDGPGPWHVDLREVLSRHAADLGIGTLSRSGHCTATDATSFFSHRRSGGADGRMVAYLGIPATE